MPCGMFYTANCEAALLVDASNVFNSINCKAALHTIAILCPSLSTVLHNTYSAAVHLLVTGEGEIPSTKGTTQGDPLTMAMYALAVVPLIRQLRAHVPEACQAWFADDATAVGPLFSLFQWWQHLSSVGPDFGYFPNASKTVLIVKPEHLAAAESIFANTNIQITAQGQRHLSLVQLWKLFPLLKLMSHRKWQLGLLRLLLWIVLPAYYAFTHGMIGHWMYAMRTIPDISLLFKPLEDAIDIYLKLLPSFTGHSCSTSERELLFLPCHLGGLGIVNPTVIADSQFDATKITNPLKDLIMKQSMTAQLPGSLKAKFIWIDECLIKNKLMRFVTAFHHLFNVQWI